MTESMTAARNRAISTGATATPTPGASVTPGAGAAPDAGGRPTAQRPTVAIAIPTFLREGVLVDTVRELLALEPAADELVVVDQSPEHEPATDAYLREQHDAGRIKWVRQSPANLPAARNRALAETTCDVVIFVDDDVKPEPDFVAAHARNYADPTVVGVAGRVVQNWGGEPTKRTRRRVDLDFLDRFLGGTSRIERVGNFMGANHSVRRSAMLAVGGYDDNYVFNGYREDTDAAVRLTRGHAGAGGRIVFDPQSCLTHLQMPSGGCQTRAGATQTKRPRWTRSYGDHYFTYRTFFPGVVFWRLWLRNYRRYVLSKANARRPWNVPVDSFAYCVSMVHAVGAARRKGRAETIRVKVN